MKTDLYSDTIIHSGDEIYLLKEKLEQREAALAEYVNKDYPRFISEENVVNVDDEEYDENTEIYDGNMFEGFEEKYEEAHHHHCEDGECKCGHKH